MSSCQRKFGILTTTYKPLHYHHISPLPALRFFSYDAIKAKEVTVPVDENGRAMLEADSRDADEDGGWLTSRVAGSQTGAQAPRKCHQLSVLHRMSWHRVIMLDVLGRKGFLTKPGTARVQAAVAINAHSRYGNGILGSIVCTNVFVGLLISQHHCTPVTDLSYLKKKTRPQESQPRNSRTIDASFDQSQLHSNCPQPSS